MENKIKVTVEYETPNTSKFDALMKEYEAAKRYADQTVAYYKPLADMAEGAKFNAILDQLETIKEYARRINGITNDKLTLIAVWIYNRRFDVVYRPGSIEHRYEIQWGGKPFTRKRAEEDRWLFFENGGIISNWEKYKAYEQLENEALRLLQNSIDKQKSRANYVKECLHNMTNGGN